jgi:hypothetical protein
MASKKFTDLPIATSADPADVLAIVDVSTDTSKQITKEDFTKDLIPQGTYTPTVSNIQFADDVTVTSCWYVDYGSVVSYRIGLDVQLSAGQFFSIFELDLPVPSNFANGRQANAVSNNSQAGECVSVLASSPAPNTIDVTVTGNAAGINLPSLCIDIEYLKV